VNETIVTVTGNVATEPTLRTTRSGARVAGFRLASTERRYDRNVREWRDGDTTWFQVTCWRALAENVMSSVAKGQPVVVHGRLRDASYEKDGQRRTVIEVEAYALGPDLARGVASFTRVAGGAGENVARDFDRPGPGDGDGDRDGDGSSDDVVAAPAAVGGPLGDPAERSGDYPGADEADGAFTAA
jgi:single-strand DNA-binding protein